MGGTAQALDPVAAHVRVDLHTPVAPRWHTENHFTVTRLESMLGLQDNIHKSSSVPALLVSVSMRSLPAADYRLRVDGRVIPTHHVPAFRANVLDIASGPACWAGSAFHFVHFHVPRGPIDELATDFGYERASEFRMSVLEDDLVLAQLAKAMPSLEGTGKTSVLALDQLELILGAHLLQRYGVARATRGMQKAELGAWQRHRATELLRENLDGSVRLADLAGECDLSVSHFCRAFKASFGVTSHQWLTERRIERAKELLGDTTRPLVDVALQAGFGDQTSFTKAFRRRMGVPPGAWRREFGKRRNGKE
jgi:AraC-like DNA-binding protein